MEEDWYCSERSLSAQEPLEGTAASLVEAFIVLEHDAPYGPKGLEDSGVHPDVVAALAAFTKLHPEVRVQLIRRPEGRRGPLALFLSRGAEGEEVLLRVALTDATDLLQIDLEAWLSGVPPSSAERVTEPLFLVCVHGRRDRCCARKGMPVFSAIDRAAPESTFQTTHLGGHRFAATLVVLPSGVCYGRVDANEAERLVRAHRTGELHDLERMRGRMRYGASAQAAEIALRRSLDLRAVDAVRFVGATPEEDHVLCTFRTLSDGVEHSMRVRREGLPPIAPSCGAEARASEAWVELRLH